MSDHPSPGPGFWYLAGPYSDDLHLRYRQHLEAATCLTKSGLTVYSPIVHFHYMAQKYDMPTDADFWESHNFNMIERSNGIILYQLPTWRDSKGVKKEILFSQMKGLPVWGLQPIQEQLVNNWNFERLF